MKSTVMTRLAAAATVATLALGAGTASAADKVKVAASQKGNWSTAMPVLAEQQGYFKAENLDVEVVWTSGGSDAQQAVISGAAQIAPQTGTLGILSAFAKGAPVRIIGASMTGSGGLYWYVRKDSKLKTLKDVPAGTTIGFSRPGSSTNLVAAALIQHFGSKAKLVSAGSATATMTQLMSGQIDIGWASPPVGLDKIKSGEIRVLVRGDDAPTVRAQTIRVHAVNADWLKANRDVATRFMRAMWKAHEFAYTPEGMKAYSKFSKLPLGIVQEVSKYSTLKNHAYWPVGGLDQTVKDAIANKRLKTPLTKAQIDELVQVVYKGMPK
jgi:NitT/TauT family transport system substrate-binding protein